MAKTQAFGAPGIEPRWTNGAKEGVGTSYAASCRLWFTLWRGVVTEVYYPTIDRPQIRDWQLLFTDGKTFFHEEKRDLSSNLERIEPGLGYYIVNTDPDGRYRVEKEVISDPHLPCVIVRVRVTGQAQLLENLQIYTLCAPHLGGGGAHNSAEVGNLAGRKVLLANAPGKDENTWMALGSDAPFAKTSVGYVGQSDGWTDLHDDLSLDWNFESAPDGNVALCGQIDAPIENGAREFTLVLAFGDGQHSCETALMQCLSVPFTEQKTRFLEQWRRSQRRLLPMDGVTGDRGTLMRASYNVILAHEDKRYPGALIASLSIPWGEAKNDDDKGGYHLVWPRDMVHSATALMAAGQNETAFRALIYLAVSQFDDGSFAQNFWLNGEPYFQSLQLDEVAFPILLAHALEKARALRDFDPMPLVSRAAKFLAIHGPITPQERWEEASGLSPSTLAATIASLCGAATMLRTRDDEASAQFLEDYADWMESNLDNWCVTDQGNVLKGEKKHYVRIFPLQVGDFLPQTPPRDEKYEIMSRPPGTQKVFEAREVFDGGFLELVRCGIRKPDDANIVASVRVMDKILRVESSRGIAYKRYNGDGYGQKSDGEPYDHWGTGHGWPLLGGERGHYDLAAGGDATQYIRGLELCASRAGMLPEQVWSLPDIPGKHMFFGHSTGAARPLAWAHGEYLKLLRSKYDGKIFDRVDEAAARYVEGTITPRRDLLFWNQNYPSRTISRKMTLRIVQDKPFRLRWSGDNWAKHRDENSIPTAIGVHFFDLKIPARVKGLVWTFFDRKTGVWDGDYRIGVGK